MSLLSASRPTESKAKGAGWKVIEWSAGIASFGLARVAPGAVLIPLGCFFLAMYLLKRYANPSKQSFYVGVALLMAHAGWILVAFLLVSDINYTAIYLVANVFASVHIYRAQSKKAVYGWSAFQMLMVLDYLSALTQPAATLSDSAVAVRFVGILIHVILSGAAAFFLIAPLRSAERKAMVGMEAMPEHGTGAPLIAAEPTIPRGEPSRLL